MTSSSTKSLSPNNPSPFHNLVPDCIHLILNYHIFHLQYGNQWREDFIGAMRNGTTVTDKYSTIFPKNYDFQAEGIGNSNWNFLRKFAHCCHFFGDEGLLEFLSACRDWKIKPTFSYLRLQYLTAEGLLDTGAVKYLRGIPELYLTGIEMRDGAPGRFKNEADLDILFENLRGVRKLFLYVSDDDGPIGPFTSNHLKNLRGVQEAYFDYCDFTSLSDDAFQNLRGIQSLTLEYCSFRRNNQILRNLRGIRELKFDTCFDVYLFAQDFRNIRGVRSFCFIPSEEDNFFMIDELLRNVRGVQELRVHDPSDPEDVDLVLSPLSDDSFKNLRGVGTVALAHPQLLNISNAPFINLRGAQEVSLQKFPDITCAMTENLRGVKKLTIVDCPGMQFSSETLYNLRGIKELEWDTRGTDEAPIVMNNESMKHLSGVEILKLGPVSAVDDEAFQYLSEVKKLKLYGNFSQTRTFSIGEAAYSHLCQVQHLILWSVGLKEGSSLSRFVHHFLPRLQLFSVHFRSGPFQEKEEVDLVHYGSDNDASIYARKEHGQWVDLK